MKRIFSLLFVAVACSAAPLAQTSLVATLTHGGNISTFYGASGLSEAYTAAVEGDVITLSPGEFTAVDLEKAVTIRGAGMQMTREIPTVLAGNITMNLPTGTAKTLTLEGVECIGTVNIYGTNNMEAATILKSYFQNSVNCANSSPTFINCVFQTGLKSSRGVNGTDNTNIQCYNCVIHYADSDGSSGNIVAKFDMVNCIVAGDPSYDRLRYSTFRNCIIWNWNGWSYSIDHQISYSLCAAGGPVETNMFWGGTLSEVFKTFTGSNYGMETFELTDEAKAKYKGDDGTQVGIYGGKYPFNPTPSSAQVKKFEVSTTATDGKLNVKINVE